MFQPFIVQQLCSIGSPPQCVGTKARVHTPDSAPQPRTAVGLSVKDEEHNQARKQVPEKQAGRG